MSIIHLSYLIELTFIFISSLSSSKLILLPFIPSFWHSTLYFIPRWNIFHNSHQTFQSFISYNFFHAATYYYTYMYGSSKISGSNPEIFRCEVSCRSRLLTTFSALCYIPLKRRAFLQIGWISYFSFLF